MKEIKVLLGDLRHHTIGVHSTYLPIGIGYIATYLQKTILDEISTEYFDEMEKGIVNNQTELHELLNRIMEKTNSAENINLLLNSISDIIMNDLFE